MSIESALLDLGSAIDYPETPDFAVPAPRRLPVKWAVAAAVVLIALVSLLVPAVRDQVAAWLGIRGVTIERTDSVDPLNELSLRVEFGEPTTLDANAVPFAPVVLPALGTPDAVYVDSEDRLTMVYVVDDQPVLNTQFLGDLNPAIVKQVEAETEVEAATVNGRPAIWVGSGPHAVLFVDANGAFAEDRGWLAGPTLLWEVGEVTMRLEGITDRDRAIAIAESIAR